MPRRPRVRHSATSPVVAAGAAHPAVMAMIHETAFPGGEAWSAAIFAGHLAVPGTFGFVHAAGGVILARAAADEAEILTIGVVPAARRHGVGRALLHAAVRVAVERGAATLFLEVSAANHAARALYAREEFAQVGVRKRYYPDGSDALVLARTLGPAKQQCGDPVG